MPTGAQTLLEIAKTMPKSQATGIIMTYATTYQPLMALPLISEPNGTHKWNVEIELPYTSGGTRLVDGSWTNTRSNISTYSQDFKIYGGQIKIDNALSTLSPGKIPQEIESQTKAKARIFTKDMFIGTEGASLRGIKDYLDNDPIFVNQTIDIGTTSAGGVLLTDHMDNLISKINRVPGRTYIYCTQYAELRLRKLQRGSAVTSDVPYNLVYNQAEWGTFSGSYDGIPIVTLKDGKGDDLLPTDDGNGSCSTIYLVTYGPELFTGFQVAAPKIRPLTQADVYEYTSFEHYVGTAVKAIRSIARLRYVSNTI